MKRVMMLVGVLAACTPAPSPLDPRGPVLARTARAPLVNRASQLVAGFENEEQHGLLAFEVFDPLGTHTEGNEAPQEPDGDRRLEAAANAYLAHGRWQSMLPAIQGASDATREHWTVPGSGLAFTFLPASGRIWFEEGGARWSPPELASPGFVRDYCRATTPTPPASIVRLDYDPPTRLVRVTFDAHADGMCRWRGLHQSYQLPFHDRLPYPHTVADLRDR
ncbi:MAG: hypothetical protein NT062_11625 [Proteobacteria bacterium]|nr:hypothetical protein [Pseudomonadota bacterium]